MYGDTVPFVTCHTSSSPHPHLNARVYQASITGSGILLSILLPFLDRAETTRSFCLSSLPILCPWTRPQRLCLLFVAVVLHHTGRTRRYEENSYLGSDCLEIC